MPPEPAVAETVYCAQVVPLHAVPVVQDDVAETPPRTNEIALL